MRAAQIRPLSSRLMLVATLPLVLTLIALPSRGQDTQPDSKRQQIAESCQYPKIIFDRLDEIYPLKEGAVRVVTLPSLSSTESAIILEPVGGEVQVIELRFEKFIYTVIEGWLNDRDRKHGCTTASRKVGVRVRKLLGRDFAKELLGETARLDASSFTIYTDLMATR